MTETPLSQPKELLEQVEVVEALKLPLRSLPVFVTETRSELRRNDERGPTIEAAEAVNGMQYMSTS